MLQLKSHIFSGLYAIEISHRAGSLEPKYLGADKKVVGGGNSWSFTSIFSACSHSGRDHFYLGLC